LVYGKIRKSGVVFDTDETLFLDICKYGPVFDNGCGAVVAGVDAKNNHIGSLDARCGKMA
jgi:hypothetical protein